MTQPYDPYQHGQQQGPAPGWAPPGQVPDPRQWQAPQYAGYPPPPKKKRKWPWVVGGLFGLLFVVPALGNSGDKPAATSTTTPSVAAQPTAPAQPLKAAEPAEEDEEAPAAPSGPQASFGDGTWTVGEDIAPGRYKSTGARAGLFEYCQITTHSDLDAQSDFIDWENGNANEPVKVNISGKVKSVKVSGCEDFVKVG